MGKLKRKSSGYSPISRKVLSGLRKTINRKVIDISELKNAKIDAENLEKSVITEKELSELDPLHGVYAYGQNKISVFVEQLSGQLPREPSPHPIRGFLHICLLPFPELRRAHPHRNH